MYNVHTCILVQYTVSVYEGVICSGVLKVHNWLYYAGECINCGVHIIRVAHKFMQFSADFFVLDVLQKKKTGKFEIHLITCHSDINTEFYLLFAPTQAYVSATFCSYHAVYDSIRVIQK